LPPLVQRDLEPAKSVFMNISDAVGTLLAATGRLPVWWQR
jgi:hypothetical protein